VRLTLPDKRNLRRTGDVDYYHWNYLFPIKYIQLYRFRVILDLLGDAPVGRLLEAGTGSGIFLPELSRHCRELHACDVHAHMDDVAEMAGKEGVNVRLKKVSLQETGYPDAYFDAVIAVSVLEFVEDLEAAVTEIRRIMKPEGVFLTICPQQHRFSDAVVNFYSRKTTAEEFVQSRARVAPLLEERFRVLDKRVFPALGGGRLALYHTYKLGR
jgi:ubiquinone/menaquinone biosynthesis C-methylase UbiE